MTRLLLLALALVLGGPALAEDQPEKKADDAQYEARIVGVRYAIHLRTGREISGVVRVRGVFERRVRGVWEECDPEDETAGVRLWFPARQDGYTFHPVETIDRVEERGPVTADESASIQIARRSAHERAHRERIELRRKRELAARNAAERAADAESEAADEEKLVAAKTAAEEAAKSPEARAKEQAYEDLLVAYPPTDWKPDHPAKIERRRVILGLQPSADETSFLAVFEEWKVAYEWWEARVAEQAAEPKKPGPTEKTPDEGSSPPESDEQPNGSADAAKKSTAANR